jgi:hypothetical protein
MFGSTESFDDDATKRRVGGRVTVDVLDFSEGRDNIEARDCKSDQLGMS